ncbi:AAA family ATPase [Nonomuraea soli]|uniref:Nuclease SbcCD subunit C n=1 Tax=Nonomuraea soli TaxID=1032476 RepID=A0A7W0HS57_9ACTN|nr:SMC family ATPase [Nonomuraea soli]MBA2893723.1 exonuclease SbcC [Nonomuraea soli]
MRPLLLTLDNFGSFREPLTVDFSDVEYFALVGPTGAGKSTVIDAICFALYGTVPRWGRENAIAHALAPSATGGKVGLIFESAGKRYGVVRAMARDAKGVVRTREARLEELRDDWDDVVRSLAEGENVTAEVQRLTGLEYKFFTQCVVLPQGRFAEFLHAKPNERQDLLVQLLDAEVYNEIRMKATREEDSSRQAAHHAREQRAEFTATPQAEEEAAAKVTALRDLQRDIATELELLRARDAELERTKRELTELTGRLAELRALTMPPEVPTLAASAKQHAADVATTETRLAEVTRAEHDAEAALAGLGDRAELTAALAALDTVERLAVAAAEARATSERSLAQARESARATLEQARRDTASALEETRARAAQTLTQEKSQAEGSLASSRADGQRSLADARTAAERALAEARTHGERAASQARRQGERSLAEARTQAAAADASLERLTAAARGAAEALERAQAAYDELRHAHAAADLTGRLVVGEPCPVCRQPVKDLPAATDTGKATPAPATPAPATSAPATSAPAVSAPATSSSAASASAAPAPATSASAASAPGVARGRMPGAAGVAAQAAPGVARAPGARGGREGGDDGSSAPAGDGGRTALAAAERALKKARTDDDRARSALSQAQTAAAMLADRAARLEGELAEQAGRSARDLAEHLARQEREQADRLARLTTETGRQHAKLETETAERLARREREVAEQLTRREQELTSQLARREQDLTDQAARLASELAAQVARLEAELAQHRSALPDGADRADLTSRLAAVVEADRRAAEARKAARACRAELEELRKAAALVSRRAEEAWAALGTARDKLMVLGLGDEAAPPVDRADLHAAWQDLITWRNRVGTAARAKADETEQSLSALAELREQQVKHLRARLDDHAVPAGDHPAAVPADGHPGADGRAGGQPGSFVLAGGHPDQLAAAVATALARAEGLLERLREDLAKIAELDRMIADKEREAGVAHELALRLRANAFERWLCAEALAVLVATASETLRELSDGQYELELGDKSEIEVIDHAEAGMRRSARTLSGGETFQAALALALALSGTVARGLDSIFLDEGFGTLDPATLDTVAATLERLAAGQERMVGVVTHVQALADRVPVRFAVHRDTTGSHLRRIDT